MKKFTTWPAAAALILVTVAVAVPSGCAGPTKASAGTEGDWVKPDERKASELRLKARTVEVLQPQDRVEFDQHMTWFATQGEVAFPTVLSMAASSDPKVSSFGLATIYAIGDRRLLAPLEARLPFSGVTDLATRLSYARAALAMGEFSYAPVLLEGMMIEGMDREHIANRGLAFQALRTVTRKGLPFSPGASPEVRARQIEDWRTWINGWLSDPMLDGQQDGNQPGQSGR